MCFPNTWLALRRSRSQRSGSRSRSRGSDATGSRKTRRIRRGLGLRGLSLCAVPSSQRPGPADARATASVIAVDCAEHCRRLRQDSTGGAWPFPSDCQRLGQGMRSDTGYPRQVRNTRRRSRAQGQGASRANCSDAHADDRAGNPGSRRGSRVRVRERERERWEIGPTRGCRRLATAPA